MILSREKLLSALFRETDRAQRMKLPLVLVSVEFALGEDRLALTSELDSNSTPQSIVERFMPLLRCYDLIGQTGDRDFLLVLPGCRISYARSLVERLLEEIFSVSTGGCRQQMHLQPCFGIASSRGRSPFVVLREVDQALEKARIEGPGSIRSIGADEEAESFFLPVYHDETLHW